MHLPIQTYDILERHLGRERSRAVGRYIEEAIEQISDECADLARRGKSVEEIRRFFDSEGNALILAALKKGGLD
jgi:predicted DNA-binding protein